MENVFKAVTDERLIVDFVVPGFGKDAITVKTARVNGGEAFKITVEGKYKGHVNKDGAPIPRVAFEKYVEDFNYTLSDDDNYGDELFRSRTFNTKDYDLDKLVWSVKDGVVRVSVPKTALACGKTIEAVDNADKDSTGVPTSDAVATVTDDND